MEGADRNFNILQFLFEYEKYPCLWDKTHIDFKNRLERSAAEEVLMEITNISDVHVLRRKIRNIRGTYNHEIRKIKAAFDEGKSYTPKLVWFSVADRFLRSSSEISSESSFEVLTGGSSDCEKNEDEPTDKKLFYEMDLPVPSEVALENTDDTSTSISLLKRSSRFKKRCNKSSSENDILNIIKTHMLANKLNSTNEFVAFGNSVAAQLQKMPLELALQLQADIQSLISSKRLEHLRMNSNCNK